MQNGYQMHHFFRKTRHKLLAKTPNDQFTELFDAKQQSTIFPKLWKFVRCHESLQTAGFIPAAKGMYSLDE